MEITTADVENILAAQQRRVAVILAAGGIAHMLVVDHRAVVPNGWVLDQETYFWIPPNLDLTNLETSQ